MRKHVLISAAIALCLSACHTTEANYRAAYEKAVAARDSVAALEAGSHSAPRPLGMTSVELPGGRQVSISRMTVSVYVPEGEQAPVVKRYGVVAGRFKQIFNANSLYKRLAPYVGEGRAIVESAEPYVYVLSGTYDSLPEATAAVSSLLDNDKIKLIEPAPMILDLYVPKPRTL